MFSVRVMYEIDRVPEDPDVWERLLLYRHRNWDDPAAGEGQVANVDEDANDDGDIEIGPDG